MYIFEGMKKLIYIPDGVAKALKHRAIDENKSLQKLIEEILSQAVGAKDQREAGDEEEMFLK